MYVHANIHTYTHTCLTFMCICVYINTCTQTEITSHPTWSTPCPKSTLKNLSPVTARDPEESQLLFMLPSHQGQGSKSLPLATHLRIFRNFLPVLWTLAQHTSALHFPL